MDQIALKGTQRATMGKKVRFLRRQGITPVHIFGHGIEPLAVQCDTASIRQVLAQAGKTRLISFSLANEKKPRIVVAREVQSNHLTSTLLHVDFYQVNMEEKVKVEVPIVLVGEAPALKSKENMLMEEINTLTVECLPAKIPNRIEVDISQLSEVDQMIRVADIKLDSDVIIIGDPGRVVAGISIRPQEKLAEEKVVVEEKLEAEAEAPKEEAKEEE